MVEVAVMANAMGRRLPKGATPSSNLAGGGENAGRPRNGDRPICKKNGRPRKGRPKKESKCEQHCDKYVTGVARFKIVVGVVFGV